MTNEANWIHLVTRAVEIVGTAIIVVGSFGALAGFLFRMATASKQRDTLVAAFRSNLGRSIENAFCRLKDFRRIATRYDKLAANFLLGVALATALAFWL